MKTLMNASGDGICSDGFCPRISRLRMNILIIFIIHYCENSRIRDILHSLNAEVSHPRHLVAFTEKRLEVMKQDHLKILKYIKARSYSRAAKALEKHHNNRYYGFMEEYMKMIIK